SGAVIGNKEKLGTVTTVRTGEAVANWKAVFWLRHSTRRNFPAFCSAIWLRLLSLVATVSFQVYSSRAFKAIENCDTWFLTDFPL
ncbi:hypothetical protein AVEN_51425-1, partial [Araneus ventricosus]